MNDEINHLRFALADTEALCLQHEEVITRLTAELAKSERVAKFWEDELIGSKNAINGLLAELAEAKKDKEQLEKTLRMAAGELSACEGYTTKPPYEVYDNLICAAVIDAAKDSGKVGYIRQGSYTCNGSPRGCEGERFGGCDHCAALDDAKLGE